MIKKFISKVNEFHTAFNINTLNTDLRYNLFQEELEEYIEGMGARNKGLEYFTTVKGDYVHTETYILDAVCDMYYILAGTCDLHKYEPFNLGTHALTESRIVEILSECNESYKRHPKHTFPDTLVITILPLGRIFRALNRLMIYNNYQDIIEEAFNIVHDSNMSKLDENGKPIINGENGVFDKTRPVGKVLKSDRFYEPTEKLYELLQNKK